MTDAVLSPDVLKCLELCRSTAVENLAFYECLYDSLQDSNDRDAIGQAMVQKQSFLGAMDAIFNNHGMTYHGEKAANDCNEVLDITARGEHLNQEKSFQNALKAALSECDDEQLVDLLNDHYAAAELAFSAIKATSLKL